MKRWLIILVTFFVGILVSENALSATYNATGIWSYETKNNTAIGCSPNPDSTGIVSADQRGDSVLFIVDGMPYTGTVSGVRYEVSTSYPEEGGQTTDTITIDLKPGGTSGSGTGEWEYTEPGFSCSGEYEIEITKLQEPPTHKATAVWLYQTSNNVAYGCGADTNKTGYTALNQNGNTFTYTDEMGIFTGRISGKKYLSSIQYEEDAGDTTQTIYVELSDNGQTGSGYEIWTWTDGYDACMGWMDIDIWKQPTEFTWDASGEWNYTEKDNITGEVTTGEVTITQDGITFTIVGYKNKEPQAGLLSLSKYIATVSYPESYPEGDGTKTESIVFDLTSNGTKGSGTISWYWTDGLTNKWGSSVLTLNKTATTNKRPNKPTLSAPTNGATNVSLTPTLETGSFSDPDRGDTHQQTEWQIGKESDFSSTVLSATSDSTTLIVPNFALDVGKKYYWRARSYDNHSAGSAWSDVYSFTTTTTTNDQDGDGVPDSQENETVDLDGDGTPDSQQNHIKSLNTEVDKNIQMGVSRGDDPTVTAIGSIESIDPATVSDIARPYYMPFGLFGAELTLAKPTDAAEVTIYFSEPVPVEVNGLKVKWYVHNAIDGWVDYSKQATFSADRKSVHLRLKDWGYGDADGIPNGTIVDPGGIGLASWINGNVSASSTGKPVNHAVITISGLVLRTLFDGNYLSMILPGTYSISVSASGYESLNVGGVQIPEGGIVTKNFILEEKPRARAMPWIPLLLLGD